MPSRSMDQTWQKPHQDYLPAQSSSPSSPAQPDPDNAEDFADDLNLTPPAEEPLVEGDWNDEEDEDFDDQMEFEEDMREIRTGDDVGEPDPEDDDHMPNGDVK